MSIFDSIVLLVVILLQFIFLVKVRGAPPVLYSYSCCIIPVHTLSVSIYRSRKFPLMPKKQQFHSPNLPKVTNRQYL